MTEKNMARKGVSHAKVEERRKGKCNNSKIRNNALKNKNKKSDWGVVSIQFNTYVT